MPRHDRSHGEHHTSAPGGGKLTRRTRTPGSGYDKDYRREDWRVQPTTAAPPRRVPVFELSSQSRAGLLHGAEKVSVLVEMSRKNGSSSTPQTPKAQPKGGSKPAGTPRPKPSKPSK
jgi:hypothetical protein